MLTMSCHVYKFCDMILILSQENPYCFLWRHPELGKPDMSPQNTAAIKSSPDPTGHRRWSQKLYKIMPGGMPHRLGIGFVTRFFVIRYEKPCCFLWRHVATSRILKTTKLTRHVATKHYI